MDLSVDFRLSITDLRLEKLGIVKSDIKAQKVEKSTLLYDLIYTLLLGL